MCFSPEADLVGGLIVGAIGWDVVTHLRGRRRHYALAALPLIFAAHEVVESVVWWSAEGRLAQGLGTVAVWVYLLVAFVLLPTYVPWASWLIEPRGRRRQAMAGLAVLGAAVSGTLLVAMLVGPVTARVHGHHIAYGTGLRAGWFIVGLYVLVTCGALVLSGEPVIRWFGLVNLVAVGVIAVLIVDGLASVWCAWAAVTSAAFAAYLRREDPQLFDHGGGPVLASGTG